LEVGSRQKRIDKVDWITIAKDSLQKAYTCFQKAEMIKMVEESLYLIARVYNELALNTMKRVRHYRAQRDHRAASEAADTYKEHISYRDSASKRFILSREARVRPIVRSINYLNDPKQLLQRICSF